MKNFQLILLVCTLCVHARNSAEPTNHFAERSHAQLMEAAEQLRSDGNYSEASAQFRHLFNSVRANNGLFHEQPFPVLDRLIHVSLANADWPALKQYLDYHDWLLNRLYNNDPQQLAEQLQINASYHEQAALETAGPARNWHLVQIRHQLWRAVTALETLPDESSELPALLHKIAMHHYALSRQDGLRWLTSFETRSDEPAMISGWAMQGNEITKRSYEIGAELILRIAEHYERHSEQDVAAQANIMSQLLAYRGDWELLFGREDRATDLYQQSLDIASQSSCKNLIIGKLFETPVGLPMPSITLDSNICSVPDTSSASSSPDAAVIDQQPDLYRPQWHQQQWQFSAPSTTALGALDSSDHHD